MEIKINDIVELKKAHPCINKSKKFIILSIDGEVRLKCVGCNGVIFLKRSTFEKNLKKEKM